MQTRAAEIIAIGDEVLRGEIVNSNAALIASALEDVGWCVVRHTVVADDTEAILAALCEARARIVLVSGGLGPTRDDITSECAARHFGVRRVLDEEVLEGIRAFFERVGYPMSENNRNQALFPEGAVILRNPLGTAPGFRLSRGEKHFFFVPGVPREMARMLHAEILPFLEGILPEGAHRAVTLLRTFGMGESRLDERLGDVTAGVAGVTIGFRTQFPENVVRIVADGRDRAEAEERLLRVRTEVERRLGPMIVAEGERTIEEVVGALLTERGLRLATAESCSGGLLAHRITNVPGSSVYFERGVVTYSNEAKTQWLGVPAEVISAHGAVSDRVAIAMAEGIRKIAGTDLGVGITGIAGPGGAAKEKPVGLVYIALAAEGGTQARKQQFFGDRDRVKTWSTAVALNLIRLYLLDLAGPSSLR